MIDVSLILCDFAEQDPTGKVHLLGAGWSVIGPAPAPHAVVFFVRASAQNSPMRITLKLLNAGNEVFVAPGPAGMQRFEFPGQVEMRRVPGTPDDVPGEGAFAVNVGILPLQPGSKYSWVLEVEGKEEARASFYVREGAKLDAADPPTAPS